MAWRTCSRQLLPALSSYEHQLKSISVAAMLLPTRLTPTTWDTTRALLAHRRMRTYDTYVTICIIYMT